ncbi:MAG TPA: hypothetical protein PKJ90_05935 [Bacteroidia bacterium]|nr:hypothetical protein [Bacteroidia bacterium]
MAYRITKPDRSVEGVVAVPVSKSEAGRIAIINALRGVAQNNDCLATDTVKLQELLFSEEHTLDAQDGGTTARFLMAYCVVRNRAAVITGSPRLRQRPMSCSVDLLRVLGAEISYLEEEGFLPVSVQAAKLKVPDVVQTSAEKTSQHISALMMIAPLFGKDFTIELTGILSSLPYIELTADLMQQVGVNVQMTANRIQINGSYNNNILSAGGDWSAASYFFETAALADMADITIENLNSLSKQGDKVIAQMVKSFGVDTIVEKDKIILKKQKNIIPDYFTHSFLHYPDIALSMAAVCGGCDCKADLLHLHNLIIKESDRVSAFQREAYKLNIKTDFCGGSKLKILEESNLKPSKRILKTYNDHRLIMAFAPLALKTGELFLDDISNVSKSFPDYFEQMKSLGFSIEEVI